MMSGSPVESEHAQKKGTEQTLNRACEACRLSKVRCLLNPSGPSNQCQRCAKAGKLCVFVPPAKRRQRKRTDVRVAELEREVKQMRSLLRSNRISSIESSDRDSGEDEGEDTKTQPERGTLDDKPTRETATPSTLDTESWLRGRLEEENPRPLDCFYPRPGQPVDEDVVDCGLITMEMADEFLEIYRNELVHIWPGAIVPRNWTASQLRQQKPALFHAIVAAASYVKGDSLSDRLNEAVVQYYAKSLLIKGEKSLQFIQALLITVAYYSPPPTPAQLLIYQYGTMAASMALELGLAYKPRTHEELPKRAVRTLQRISSTEELLENCRTILILYCVTAGFSTRLRRPNILLYNSWMEESLSLLQKSPLLDDKRVVAWIKLQRIIDEGMSAFGFDDASTSFRLSELRLQVILRIFERRMEDWLKSCPPEVLTMPLMLEYHQNSITIWEFGMDGGRYDAPAFRNTHLTLPALDEDTVQQPESLYSRSALQINATIKCVSAAHSLLDCFTKVPTETLQKSPNVVFARAIYALLILLKADYAVGTDAEGLGVVLDSESLKVDYYLNIVIDRTTQAVGSQKCRIPSHWLFIFKSKVKTWHDEHQQWRQKGRHRKRASGPPSGPPSGTGTGPGSSMNDPQSTMMDPHDAATSTQTMPSSSSAPGTGQLPNFELNNTYPNWQANNASMPSGTEHAFQPDQIGIPEEPSDFTAAFQNGDLYFWNNVNDNFGGWIPQGGMYNDMQFGGMNNGF